MNHSFPIHIEWTGPFPLHNIDIHKQEYDYGIYQIYGWHPVYGSDVLLYIGKADRQHFGVRIPQETWWATMPDAQRTTVYLGRISGVGTPDDQVWGEMIDRAERLLIFAHTPAHNAQKSIHSIDNDLHEVHIFNWGFHRDLLPELSGSR